VSSPNLALNWHGSAEAISGPPQHQSPTTNGQVRLQKIDTTQPDIQMDSIPYGGSPPQSGGAYERGQTPSRTGSTSLDSGIGSKRKAVRAQQACDACRHRKAKCNEGRPSCAFCTENHLACVYREVPPPKVDRHLQMVLDLMEKQGQRIDSLTERIECIPGLEPLPVNRKRPVVPEEDNLPGFSIPRNHTTAAHKLLRWEAVSKLLEGLNISENYAMECEMARGSLRLFGAGEGSYVDDQDNNWGSNGGLEDDERNDCWNLDRQTMQDLCEAYFAHIHIMHPILNRQHIENRSRAFIMKYLIPSQQSPAQRKKDTSSGVSDQRSKSKGDSTLKGKMSGKKPRKLPLRDQLDRTIDIAILLLVIALGKTCEHKDFLGPPAPILEQPPPGASQSQGISSSRPETSMSSVYNNQSPESQASPGNNPGSSQSRSTPRPRNIEVIPGLAYYTTAAQILAETVGDCTLSRIQAGLLAGLYCGQLARPLDSWKWIDQAGRDCYLYATHLLKSEAGQPSKLDQLPGPEKFLVQVNYWTALQLESDLLAEIDARSSGIDLLESSFNRPDFNYIVANQKPSTHEEIIGKYYQYQLSLRQILNGVHGTLYRSDQPVPLAIETFTRELVRQVKEWRKALVEQLKWSDDDPPPNEINAARLRAKYWGATYIINRPWVWYILHEDRIASPADGLEAKHIEDACRTCLKAAVRSTRAFHGILQRPIITNIFGTAHA
jgi:hypothetical protein